MNVFIFDWECKDTNYLIPNKVLEKIFYFFSLHFNPFLLKLLMNFFPSLPTLCGCFGSAKVHPFRLLPNQITFFFQPFPNW